MIVPMINDYNDPAVNRALLSCSEALGHNVTETFLIIYLDEDIAYAGFPMSECQINTPECMNYLTKGENYGKLHKGK